jgi:hypothetical protein
MDEFLSFDDEPESDRFESLDVIDLVIDDPGFTPRPLTPAELAQIEQARRIGTPYPTTGDFDLEIQDFWF